MGRLIFYLYCTLATGMNEGACYYTCFYYYTIDLFIAMQQSEMIAIELYAIIQKGNYSFLRMNRVIRHHHYEIRTLPLNEFEARFRELYNLEAYTDQLQDHPVSFIDKTGTASIVHISKEFYQVLDCHSPATRSFLHTGYVAFLRTARSLYMPNKNEMIDVGLVMQSCEQVKHFTERLEHCLRLTRYGHFEFDLHFAYIPSVEKVIPYRKQAQIYPLNTTAPDFIERDNYLLSVLLKIDNKLSDFISLALQSFEESFHIKNTRIRFVQLMFCLEVCFNTSIYEPVAHIIARHTSLLIAGNKQEFHLLYNEVLELCNVKNSIINGEMPPSQNQEGEPAAFTHQVARLEEITRNTLKKLLRLNIRDKETLFNELNLKTMSV